MQSRLHKLDESGIITGYTVRLRPDSEPQRIRALRAERLAAFDAALGRLRLTSDIANTGTRILLSTYKA